MKHNFSKIQTALFLAATLACLILYSFFPAEDDFLKWLLAAMIFLVAVPLAYLKYVVKESPDQAGLSVGNWRAGWRIGVMALALSLAVAYLASQTTRFAAVYEISEATRSSFSYFLFHVAVTGMFIVIYDIFFRGFFMLRLKKSVGAYAMVSQVVLFAIFATFSGEIDWSLFPYALITLFSGPIAYYSGSIIYSSAYGILFSLVLEAVLINLK